MFSNNDTILMNRALFYYCKICYILTDVLSLISFHYENYYRHLLSLFVKFMEHSQDVSKVIVGAVGKGNRIVQYMLHSRYYEMCWTNPMDQFNFAKEKLQITFSCFITRYICVYCSILYLKSKIKRQFLQPSVLQFPFFCGLPLRKRIKNKNKGEK